MYGFFKIHISFLLFQVQILVILALRQITTTSVCVKPRTKVR